MKALVFDKSGLSFQPKYRPPAVTDGDTLIKVKRAGVCATDLEIVKGYMGFSGVLGHEFVGVVSESTNKELVGQRVVGEINMVCGRCDMCMSGLSAHCRNRTVLGISGHDGAFAELVRLPAENVHVLPKAVDDDQAVFVEPLAAAFEVLRQVKLDGRSWVTVLGDGRLGLLMAQVMRNAGVPVRVIGKHEAKLALCEKWQIRSRPLKDIIPRHDQDVVVECTGTAEGLEMAVAMCRPRGTVVLKSTVAVGKPLNLAPVVIDEITILGSRCGPFAAAIRALEQREVEVTSLIHKRFKLDQAVEAMAHAAKPGVLKVLIDV
jgi:threonine dehydrogenase-like Zn-dependent dehydrogenase